MRDDPAMGHLFEERGSRELTVKKSNDYRAKMLNQLAKYARHGEREKFDRLAYIIAKTSRTFRHAMIMGAEPKI